LATESTKGRESISDKIITNPEIKQKPSCIRRFAGYDLLGGQGPAHVPGAFPAKWSDDYIKSTPVFPGGLLTSKPTWSNARGCSATSAFFVLGGCHDPLKQCWSNSEWNAVASGFFPPLGVSVTDILPDAKGNLMNGRKLLERGLRLGVALWRIEEELDWHDNQRPRKAARAVRKPSEPVTENEKNLVRSHTHLRVAECGSDSAREYIICEMIE
jgi:hypothetical protein